MPIFRDFSDNDTRILIWKYQEGEIFDKDFLLEPEILHKIKGYHHKKQMEVLMIRKMLKMLLPDYKIFYHENGEPYLQPSDRYISISHSFPYAAIAVSKRKIGIDLEKIDVKLQKLKSKFLYKTEYEWTENPRELDFLTAIWTIKEALYKIHPAKFWSFREYYEVSEFGLEASSIECRVFSEISSDSFTAEIKKIEDFYLAVVQ